MLYAVVAFLWGMLTSVGKTCVGRGHDPADQVTKNTMNRIRHKPRFFTLISLCSCRYCFGGVMTPPYTLQSNIVPFVSILPGKLTGFLGNGTICQKDDKFRNLPL